MANLDEKIKDLCMELYEIGALKFGDFKMKVGINSPVYFDMRVMVSYPPIMDKLADVVWGHCQRLNIESTVICGVPYTALPVATLVSVKSNLPMLIRRKEPKKYGTMKLIEGKFKEGENCLIIEDVVTSGGSILETATDLKNDGLIVTDAIVMVDRQQGGKINLTNNGIRMHSILTLAEILNLLLLNKKLDQDTVDRVRKYIEENQISPDGAPLKTLNVWSGKMANWSGKSQGIVREFRKSELLATLFSVLLKRSSLSMEERQKIEKKLSMSYSDRANLAACKAAKKLFNLMEHKKTNLCAALDVNQSSELLHLADAVGPHVCIVKTHFDAVQDWSSATENSLKELAKKHNFIIMEDRKFGDIGNTVKVQCEKVLDWAELVTVHSIGGPGALEGAKNGAKLHTNGTKSTGVFLVAELSCKGNLISPQYTEETVRLGEEYKELVIGFVCQNPSVFTNAGFIQLTPGVSLSTGGDTLGQQYVTPEDAVLKKGGDVIVVGRAISQSANPQEVAQQLKTKLWNAYEQRTSLK